ncbi:aquaporin [Streptomyces sp. 7-21]|uniref:aquaporin n=1 Tax=Streptomyces sp. 7-21 TaxID=2802283 RepID=UPI00191D28A1|nr:aquaporin [Streptomyces sp. 7-21]MBL1067361.1 aquaporin [Streptomyces sp. 7-21]
MSAWWSRESVNKSLEAEPESLAAELVGTLILVFVAVGTAVLAGEYAGSFGVALAAGFTLLALAYALGPVSGSHVNPAVTLGMLLAGRMSPRTAVGYWIAQVVGAVLGALLLFIVARQVPGLETSEAMGSNGFGDRSAVGVSGGGAFVAEVLLTFLLVYVWLAVTDRVTLAGYAGLAVGLAYGAAYLVAVPLTGASLNPARSLGPALFAGGSALTELWLFLLAPLIGAAVAVAVHWVTHPRAAAVRDAGAPVR